MSNPKYTIRDGFQVRELEFAVPTDTRDLDPRTKRDLTICNLFINQKLTIRDIIRILDEDSRHVVMALLENGMINDRRQRSRLPSEGRQQQRSGNA